MKVVAILLAFVFCADLICQFPAPTKYNNGASPANFHLPVTRQEMIDYVVRTTGTRPTTQQINRIMDSMR